MLKIRIDTGNFGNNLRQELIKCLENVIRRIDYFEKEGNIFDTNGNKVGNYKLTNR